MKHYRSMNVRVKSLIYSSAILAALAPAMEAEAQEAETPDVTEQIEQAPIVKENRDELLEILSPHIEQIGSEDLSLYTVIEITQTLHINEDYTEAQALYRILGTYPELDDTVKAYLHKNGQLALNETSPEEFTLTEEQIIELRSVSVLTESDVDQIVMMEENTQNSTEPVEESSENLSELSEHVSEAPEEDQLAETEEAASEDLESEVVEETEPYIKLSETEESADSEAEDTLISTQEETEEVSAEITEEVEKTAEPVTEAVAEPEEKASKEQATFMTTSSTSDADALYNTSIESSSVTEAWYTAIEGYTKYPNDKRFEYAIEKAAGRSLNYADSLASRDKTDSALAYYKRTLDSPWLTEALTIRATDSITAVEESLMKPSSSEKADELYNTSINSGSVTEAWYTAVEGYNTYPDDNRFEYAIEKAAVRSLNYADSLEERNDLASALAYYDRTLDSPWLTTTLRNRAETSKTRVSRAIEETDKEALYQASVSSGSVSTAWYKALEGYNKYPGDARFKDAIEKAGVRSLNYADSLEDKGNLDGALAYYGRTLESPWLTSALKDRAETSQARVSQAIEEAEKETLYQESVGSGSVSTSWYTALEGYNKYPNDARFKDAIEKAAIRSLNYADSLEAKGKATNAIPYYARTIDAPWMTDTLIKRATDSKARMLKVIEEEDKTALYNASVDSPYVSEAWNKAIEGYTKYPTDSRFQDAIRKAAVRNLNYADSLESKGKASSSIQYYDKILNAPWMPNDLYERAFNSKEEMLKYLDSDYVYQEILKEKNQIIAWEMAAKATIDHPEDDRISDYITKQAEIILADAIALHKDYQYDRAIQRYDLLITGPSDLYDDEDIAEKYKILAMNDLIPNHASYQNSYYYESLDEALDEQMRRAPQTQSGGKWVNASRAQTEYYLNPDNFIKSIDYDKELAKVTGIVTASALNVRSGSGTSHSAIDMVYNGKEVTIIGEANGWYEIMYVVSGQNRTGWVSGVYVQKDSKESIKHDFNDAYNPVARIIVGTLNVRQGPGTSHSIVTQVHSGQRYTILKGSGGWYQLDLGNGQHGWVSGEYVTVSNTLDKDLLQFLKLSGSSGIDETRLNEEIGNSGVLTGKGHIFLEASQRYNINEIYLLAHAKLETGNGSSSLAKGIVVSEVDGKAVEPKKVYNMFGIAAFDSSPLKSGSEYAYKMGWDSVDKAIMGGAEWISKQYVNHATHKQDTLYKMRWNPLDPGAHQYATDIGWAYKQTHTLNTLVEVSQRYDLHLNFDIPVYNQ
ncbi:SH3 domain-containing protein [Alkalibacterium kapii]|uniref:SH3b domain-containing protein n=1 Tax=Alkalibacterium kapii TaxID=426704 RepID=A0A511AS69_9LACT|nr:SH3 domain-containing protein [Alkalibacterium kapii]GEK91049.1 hypothetical protein AKA01nite_06710 [Alkalibacterium kapii]